MKGDFSRQTFDPRKHYSSVLMQQGRVQLDADWNEQAALTRYRDETEATDVIGGCGAPVHAAGFEITSDGEMLFISQGRYYVDGILVENDLGKLATAGDALPARIAYDDQDKGYLPGADLKAALAALAEKGFRHALAYLDVWQRHVTALDDGRLREVALGGPDTTTRIQTVWQVKLLPVAATGGDPTKEAELLQQKAELDARLVELGAAQDQLAARIEEAAARLAALPPRDAGRKRLEALIARFKEESVALDKQREELAAALKEIAAALEQLAPAQLPGCDASYPAWEALRRPSGYLNARAQPGDPADDPCELPPGGGYTRLENQLYRVEIHRPGGVGQATFKWSRDNGTVVSAIESISGSSVFVDSLGPDDVLGFAIGHWVELTDDALELNGLPGQLARIVDVKAATRELVLSPAPDKLAPAAAGGVNPARHPKLRRWDQVTQPGAAAGPDGVATADAWLPLEDGVQVRFSLPDPQAEFRTGDYWLIPARTATAELEWPPFEHPNTDPQPQPRLGIEHHFCRLALVAVQDGKLAVLEDCRKLFPPLTELPTAQALHVEAISWNNDGLLPTETLNKDGLRIRLNAAPDPASVSNDSVLVTVDFPYVQNNQAVPNIRQRLVILGTVGIDPNDPRTIIWRYQETQAPVDGTTGPRPVIGGFVPLRPRDATGGVGAHATTRPTGLYRVNVTLRGRFIWRTEGRKRLFLDGQAFGQPVAVPGANQVRTDLILPSGDGERASDFESWFYVGADKEEVDTLRVRQVGFGSMVASRPSSTVLVVDELPPGPDTNLVFKASEQVNRIRVAFTRAVQPEGEFPVGEPQSALVELLDPQGFAFRRHGSLVVKGDMLEFRAQDPSFLNQAGEYRLTVFAEDSDFGPGIHAQDDGSALDGDFDGQSGGNFVLLFRVA